MSTRWHTGDGVGVERVSQKYWYGKFDNRVPEISTPVDTSRGVLWYRIAEVSSISRRIGLVAT